MSAPARDRRHGHGRRVALAACAAAGLTVLAGVMSFLVWPFTMTHEAGDLLDWFHDQLGRMGSGSMGTGTREVSREELHYKLLQFVREAAACPPETSLAVEGRMLVARAPLYRQLRIREACRLQEMLLLVD